MRVLVCGGRNFTDRDFIFSTLNNAHKRVGISVLIEGNGPGADRIAGYWARQKRIDNLKFKPEWEKYGPAAGPLRNQRMLDEGRPDLVIAFPGGRGTADMVRRAKEAGVQVLDFADHRTVPDTSAAV